MTITTPLVSPGLVRGAYTSSRSLSAEPGGQAGFADLVRNAAANSVETLRQGEAMSATGLAERAKTQDVVESVLAMQSTLEVAVSMRDRFVEAYQEILRMPI